MLNDVINFSDLNSHRAGEPSLHKRSSDAIDGRTIPYPGLCGLLRHISSSQVDRT